MATRKKTVRYAATTIRGKSDFDTVFVATTNGTVFTNETTDAAGATTGDVPLGTAVDDALYFGMSTKQFSGVWIDMSTNTSGGTRVIEYWNGATWTTLSATVITGSVLLTADTALRWNVPADWATTTVNSVSAYWVRIRTTVLHTNGGIITSINSAPVEQVWNALSVEIPEGPSGRTFESVFAKIWYHTPVGSTQLDFVRIQTRIDAGVYSDAYFRTASSTLTGESVGTFFYVDLTSQFTTDFTGNTHTIDMQFSSLSRGTIAVNRNICHYSAELYISYSYDDTAGTQLCSVVLPIESIEADLTTSLASIGTNQIPALSGGILQQSGVILKDFYIAFQGNIREAGTTDYNFNVALDAEAETILGDMEAANQSDIMSFFLWKRTDVDITTTHDVKARVSNTAGAVFTNIGGYAVCTFSYDHSGSVRLTETFFANLLEEPGFSPGTTANLKGVQNRQLFIQEANPILNNSGFDFYYASTGDPGSFIIKSGNQTERTYQVSQGVGGSYMLTHRIDSGSAVGAGIINFDHGLVNINTEFRATTTSTNASSVSALLILTYSYDKSPVYRSQTMMKLIEPDQATAGTQTNIASAVSSAPFESNYYLNSAAYFGHLTVNSATTGNALTILVNLGDNLGWEAVISQLYLTDNEKTETFYCGRERQIFMRYPGDPDTARVDIKTPKTIRVQSLISGWHSAISSSWWYDYNYPVSGIVSGYSGDGSGIIVNVFDAETETLIKNITTDVGGVFSDIWYDNTRPVYCKAYQSSTRKGLSVEQIAQSGNIFTIELQPSGSVSVEPSFTFVA